MNRLRGRLEKHAGWLGAALGTTGFVFIPDDLAKFISLGVGLWLAARKGRSSTSWLSWVLLSVFAYASGFILNPVWSAPFLRLPGLTADGSAGIWLAVLVLVGCGWLAAAIRSSGPPDSQWAWPGGWTMASWMLLLVLLHAAAWTGDVSYGGDEHYHMAAVCTNGVLARLGLAKPQFAGLLVVWLAAGLALGGGRSGRVAGGTTANSFAGLAAFAPPARLLLAWGALGLALAALVAWRVYPSQDAVLNDVHQRAVRYPAAQPWLSAVLGLACYESWGQARPFSFALLRFLPMLALFLVGLFLAGDRRWRQAPLGSLLAVAAALTAPTLLYHGASLYLELPAVVLMLVVLADGRRWCLASPRWLARRPAWWAALLIGFTKDTAIAAVGLLWLTRLAVRWARRWRKRRRTAKRPVLNADEITLGFGVLGPGLLYLSFRQLQDYRPYQLHLENLASGAAWVEALGSVLVQFGAIWVLALAGAACLLRRRRPIGLVLGGVLFIGLGALHFLEDPQWIGFPRFNLLLLPPVLWLAWEGLTRLQQRNRWWAGVCALALAGVNLLSSPLDSRGGRAAWGNTPERWYDFTSCLRDIQRQSSDCTLALGNMEYHYALSLVTDRMSWRPRYSISYPPPEGMSGFPALAAMLDVAAQRSADYVIYRTESPIPLPDRAVVGSYEKVRDYPGRTGGLLLFRRSKG